MVADGRDWATIVDRVEHGRWFAGQEHTCTIAIVGGWDGVVHGGSPALITVAKRKQG